MLGDIWRTLLGDGVDRIRAVLFDAVGTIIAPTPPVAEAYYTLGEHYGSRLSKAEVAARFRAAFAASASLDGRTDEAMELARWRGIIRTVIDDLADPEPLFQDLWQHFADPGSWRLADDAAWLLTEIRAAGCLVGVASNFDARLHSVLAGQLADVPVFVSSELGWQKPHRGFFQAIESRLGLGPRELCLVGDDWENDVRGAQRADWQAIWLSENGASGGSVPRIGALRALRSL